MPWLTFLARCLGATGGSSSRPRASAATLPSGSGTAGVRAHCARAATPKAPLRSPRPNYCAPDTLLTTAGDAMVTCTVGTWATGGGPATRAGRWTSPPLAPYEHDENRHANRREHEHLSYNLHAFAPASATPARPSFANSRFARRAASADSRLIALPRFAYMRRPGGGPASRLTSPAAAFCSHLGQPSTNHGGMSSGTPLRCGLQSLPVRERGITPPVARPTQYASSTPHIVAGIHARAQTPSPAR